MEQQKDDVLAGDFESLPHSGLRSRAAVEASPRVTTMNSDTLLGTDKVDFTRTKDISAVKPVNSHAVGQGSMAATVTDEFCHQTDKEDLGNASLEDLDAFNLIEPPPLDWRSDSSSEDGSAADVDDGSLLAQDLIDTPEGRIDDSLLSPENCRFESKVNLEIHSEHRTGKNVEVEHEKDLGEEYKSDEDHTHIQELLAQLQLFNQPSSSSICSNDFPYPVSSAPVEGSLSVSAAGVLVPKMDNHECTGLLFSESHQKDLLELLEYEEAEMPLQGAGISELMPHSGDVDAVISVSYSQEEGDRFWDHYAKNQPKTRDRLTTDLPECVDLHTSDGPPLEEEINSECHPAYKDVPGPCDPEDLLDGVIFGAKYLGSTQLMSEKNPSTNARMAQAQEAVDRIKAPDGESQPMAEVDLFISTQRIKVLSADTQESMMDHPLQTISYIADIGSIVVLMARRRLAGRKGADGRADPASPAPRKNCCMICHVFTSEDAQIIAQAIGQAFGVAYQQFLQANGIKASELQPGEYSDYMGTQELYNGDLVHFSCSENIREVCILKSPGEILGLAIVESGWGSILPTVVVANLLHGGPAERSGELSIGDRIMSVNGTSVVGLPISTCQSIIRDLKCQTEVKLSIVHCPPVTMAIIKRPDPKHQLGFSVEDGIICSLMRGGIAERGGIRVGHRIIEINGQSVVATPHEKIIQILTHAVGEIHLKTMPVSTYRLLTGQEQPLFL